MATRAASQPILQKRPSQSQSPRQAVAWGSATLTSPSDTSSAACSNSTLATFAKPIPSTSRKEASDSARVTIEQIDAFEALQRNHLVYTLPSSQKQCCTEPVATASTAIAKASHMVRDMKVIGLSGLRLTGLMDHELQYRADRDVASRSHHHFRTTLSTSARTDEPQLLLRSTQSARTASHRPATSGSSVAVKIPQLPDAATHVAMDSDLAVPTLESLREPLRRDTHDEAVTSTKPSRPTSSRVVPAVRQLRVYAAPLYQNIPLAPNLTAVLKWCRTVEELRTNPFLTHLHALAATFNKERQRTAERHVGWDAGFVVAPSKGGVECDGGKAETAEQAASILEGIAARSRYTTALLHESTHGLFEDHMGWFNVVVAVWFEFCFKDVSVPKTAYRIPGCMGDSASAFQSYFNTLFGGVYYAPGDAAALYKLLRGDGLEQLSFGRHFLLMYMVLGLDRIGPTEDHFEASATSVMLLREQSFANTLFAASTADRRHSAPFSLSRTSKVSILQLWFSMAGAYLRKQCPTINVCHVESMTKTILVVARNALLDTFPTLHSDGAAPMAQQLAKLQEIELLLNNDLLALRAAIGSRVEVPRDEGWELLAKNTKLLESWLVSRCAQECQDELNAMAERVICTIIEEDKVEQHRLAMRAAAEATSPTPRKRNKSLSRSQSVVVARRKASIVNLRATPTPSQS